MPSSELPLNSLQRLMAMWNVGTCTRFTLAPEGAVLEAEKVKGLLTAVEKSVKILNDSSPEGVNLVLSDRVVDVEAAKSEEELAKLVDGVRFEEHLVRAFVYGNELYLCVSLAIADPRMLQLLAVFFHNALRDDNVEVGGVDSYPFFPVMPSPLSPVRRTTYRPLLTARIFPNSTSSAKFAYSYKTLRAICKSYGTSSPEYVMIASIAYSLVGMLGIEGDSEFTVSNLTFLDRESVGTDVRYNSTVSFASIPVEVYTHGGGSKGADADPKAISETVQALLKGAARNEHHIGGHYSYLVEQSATRLAESETPQTFHEYLTVEFCYCPKIAKRSVDYEIRWMGSARNTLSILATHIKGNVVFAISICNEDAKRIDMDSLISGITLNLDAQKPPM